MCQCMSALRGTRPGGKALPGHTTGDSRNLISRATEIRFEGLCARGAVLRGAVLRTASLD